MHFLPVPVVRLRVNERLWIPCAETTWRNVTDAPSNRLAGFAGHSFCVLCTVFTVDGPYHIRYYPIYSVRA